MNTIERTERAWELAERWGYRLRREWLGGAGGGACEFAGQKWIFLDLALSAQDQLEQILEVLRDDPRMAPRQAA